MGITFAVNGYRGEVFFSEGKSGLKAGHGYVNIVRAEAVFPLMYYTREAVATSSINVPYRIAIGAMDRALSADPHSGFLLWHKIMLELRVGNLKRAKRALDRLQHLGPDWKQTKNAENVFMAVKKRMQK